MSECYRIFQVEWKDKNNTDLNFSEIGKAIEQEVQNKFKAISDFIFNSRFVKPTGFDDQLDNFLEIYWLFVPIKKSYKKTYKLLFQELAAQKSINPIKQLDESGRKCNIDGKLNVKVYRKDMKNGSEEVLKIDRRRNYFYKLQQIINNLRKDREDCVNILDFSDNQPLKIWHIQGGEGLSAISLTKRIFNPDNYKERPISKEDYKLAEPHKFPSTVSISLLDMFNKLENDVNYIGRKDAFIQFKSKVQGDSIGRGKYLDHSDDQLFYKENIDNIFKKYSKEPNDCKSEHNKWSNKLDIPFTKYYAIIRFDGDNMGDWLLGNKLKDELYLDKFHREFTQCVDQFAAIINGYIKEPGKPEAKGKVIYSGGEDFMAIVNIHHLFDVLDTINNIYKEA